MELIVTLMQSIPEAVWAALLGSFLTLLGVVLTNRHYRSVQRTQLEHESRERDKQRKFDARAEVYLAAAAEMAKAQQTLGNLSSLDFSKESIGELLSGFLSATNQAILIARDDTAEAINEFLSAFFTAFFYLLPRIFPLQNAKVDRDIQDNLYQAYQSETKRILAVMTHINETRNHHAVDWETLDRNLQFNQARMQEAAELRDRAWGEINRLNLQFMDEVTNQAQCIARAVLPALVAMRADLDISTDIDLYQGQLEKRLELMNRLIEGFKESLREAAT